MLKKRISFGYFIFSVPVLLYIIHCFEYLLFIDINSSVFFACSLVVFLYLQIKLNKTQFDFFEDGVYKNNKAMQNMLINYHERDREEYIDDIKKHQSYSEDIRNYGKTDPIFGSIGFENYMLSKKVFKKQEKLIFFGIVLSTICASIPNFVS